MPATGGETRYLHSGGTELDNESLPDRLQLVLNFTQLHMPSWNAVMNAFRLQDLLHELEHDSGHGKWVSEAESDADAMELENLMLGAMMDQGII